MIAGSPGPDRAPGALPGPVKPAVGTPLGALPSFDDRWPGPAPLRCPKRLPTLYLARLYGDQSWRLRREPVRLLRPGQRRERPVLHRLRTAARQRLQPARFGGRELLARAAGQRRLRFARQARRPTCRHRSVTRRASASGADHHLRVVRQRRRFHTPVLRLLRAPPRGG